MPSNKERELVFPTSGVLPLLTAEPSFLCPSLQQSHPFHPLSTAEPSLPCPSSQPGSLLAGEAEDVRWQVGNKSLFPAKWSSADLLEMLPLPAVQIMEIARAGAKAMSHHTIDGAFVQLQELCFTDSFNKGSIAAQSWGLILLLTMHRLSQPDPTEAEGKAALAAVSPQPLLRWWGPTSVCVREDPWDVLVNKYS